MSFFGFHPLIERWFRSRFAEPTEPQREGWPPIAAGEHTLIAAPTGSGKTLTAFLACIDRLLKLALAGRLDDETRVVYVSPLRALSNDMHRNLEVPLAEIAALAEADGQPIPNITVGLRTGDTTPSRRTALVRRPRHILVTTPESLYLMLTGPKSRETLRTVETVIVDEIHSLVRDKRGSHLALTLERLETLCGRPLQRIGLSATQKPIDRIARFLVGNRVGVGEDRESKIEDRGWRIEDGGSGIVARPHSATGSPKPEARRLNSAIPCTVIDVGHSRELDLAIETPPSELGAVCMHEQWAEINARIVELVQQHRSTLVFVNTRRLAERVTHQLTELLGEDVVGAHHGSLSAEIRLKTERQLKAGELKAVVATASLELGLDIGYIDLVIQIGSPRSITALLQRIGRSGHSLGLVPKGRLFALTRDELLESMALIRAVRAGRLDAIPIPEAPLDVLAQQVVAEVATRECGTDELFELCRRAAPFERLSRKEFDRTIEYLSEGITRSTGRSRVYLHHDRVGRRLRARKGARIAAITNGGAIPEIASYRVVAEPEGTVVGTLDEEFAIESQAGDIFLLGNTSWRIQHVRGGDVTVSDAHGAPPTIPFWRGEAPGRTVELSEELSRLREELEVRVRNAECGVSQIRIADCGLRNGMLQTESEPRDAAGSTQKAVGGSQNAEGLEPQTGPNEANSDFRLPTSDLEQSAIRNPQSAIVRWLTDETHCSPHAAEQIVTYAAAQQAAIGLLPTQRRVVFERFFDESGGMQLVVHAPFGGAINRAWGLAMRKRFCRSFDFELQATADDDGFILSLGPQHSFPIESLFPMLTRRNARGLLEQALLTIPMFQVRWRWNVTRALLVMRMQNGKKVPPAFQRFRADDLLTAVFPKLTGCQENVVGDIEVPDHPLVNQTMHDCLHEALDVDGLNQVLEAIERGEIELIARDTREPSPFCYELLNANVYTFLDGGELQERRARAVATRRSLTVESVSDLGRLDPAAIEQVRQEARPLVRNADELHDALLSRIILPIVEADDWDVWYAELAEQHRVCTMILPDGQRAWIAAERMPAATTAFPEAAFEPALTVPDGVRRDWTTTDARVAMVRGLIEISGPITANEIAHRTSITRSQSDAALEALEGEGVVLRGHFTPNFENSEFGIRNSELDKSAIRTPNSAFEWCHRRLLARIHRLTLKGLRREIEPVGVDVFVRFLSRHHGLFPADRRSGPNGLFEVVTMLQGMDVPAVCWERDLLPSRLDNYRPESLDELCLTGELGWGRLFPPKQNPDKSRPMTSLTRVAPVSLWLRSDIGWLTASRTNIQIESLSSPAVEVLELLRERGAMFAADLMNETRMLPTHLEDALGELVTRGMLTADGFAGLRQLIAEKTGRSRPTGKRRGLVRQRRTSAGTGRWSIWRRHSDEADDVEQTELVEQWAWQLLRRWGVIFKDLLIREAGAPSWFELLRVYRRLEARGEIRGGRFVTGVGGEQFALGETVRKLRQLRDEPPQQELITLSAADPLNLVGIITDHPRIPSTASNRVAYLDGVPVAALKAGELQLLGELPTELLALIAQRFRLSGTAMPKRLLDFDADQKEAVGDAKDSNGASPTDSKKRRQPKPPGSIPRPMIS